MPTNQHKELEFKHGQYFSPGFYQAYWLDHIQDKIPNYDSFSNQKLEQYQELWIGSIFAALYTKSTGDKYYVGLPERDPPDVWLVRLVDTEFKGREATNMERMPVEITRCFLDEGENLYDQIMRKNKPAYDDKVLLVYLYGIGSEVNFEETVKRLASEERIYPIEIYVIAKVAKDGKKSLNKNTFLGMMVYPQHRQQTVELNDGQAFFSHPPILNHAGRGISRELKTGETFTVVPPQA